MKDAVWLIVPLMVIYAFFIRFVGEDEMETNTSGFLVPHVPRFRRNSLRLFPRPLPTATTFFFFLLPLQIPESEPRCTADSRL